MKNCKNFWKRGISLALALMMCLSLLPVNAFAAPTTCGKLGCNAPLVFVPEVPATCAGAGVEAHYECTNKHNNNLNGEWLDKQVPRIPQTGNEQHNWTYTANSGRYAGTHKKTCNNTGWVKNRRGTWEQTTCGKTVSREACTYVDGVCKFCGYTCPHPESRRTDKTSTDATCTAPASESYKCGVCGKTVTTTSGDPNPNAHNYPETGTYTAAAECGGKGYTTYVCANGCGVNNVVYDTTATEHLPTCTVGTEWTKGETHHWHERTCGAKEDEAEHAWNNGVVNPDPTCTTVGTKTYTCTVCGATKTEEVDPNGHTLVKTEAKAATCQETGNNEYWTCEICHKVFKADKTTETTVEAEKLAMKAHEWDTDTWLKDETGHWHKCKNCDAISAEVKHNMQQTTAEWNASYEQFKSVTVTFKCQDCSYESKTTYEKTTGFMASPKVTVTANKTNPTCCTEGTCAYTVIVSNRPDNQPNLKLQSGEYTCDKLPHQYTATWLWDENSDGEVRAVATLSCIGNNGWCTTGGRHTIIALESLSNLSAAPSTATCENPGVIVYTAKVTFNGVEYEDSHDEPVDKLGHDYGDWTVTVDPTATTEGTAERVCERPTANGTLCGYKETVTLPALGTSSNDWAYAVTTEPTCTTKGKGTYAYTDGTEVIVDIPENPDNHPAAALEWRMHSVKMSMHYQFCTACNQQVGELVKHGDENITTMRLDEPTCTVQGVDQHHCAVCGGTWRTHPSKIPHTLTRVEAKDPTCTEDGNYEYWVCDVCDGLFSDNAVKNPTATTLEAVTRAKLNHQWGDWIVTTKPTATTEGTAKRTCERGCEETVTLPALGEDGLVEDYKLVTPPSCTEKGEATYTADGETVTVEIPALGHNTDGVVEHVNATCTVDGIVGGAYCTRCEHGKSDAKTAIPATGHTWGEWIRSINPTYTSEGSDIRFCMNCTESQTRPVAALELPDDVIDIPVTPVTPEEPEIEIEDEQTPLAGMPYALNPEDELTRGHLMYVLHWFDGEPEAEISTFIDVAFDAYYSTAVGWAEDENIARGTPDNKFMPEDTVTRGQMEVFLTRYAEYLGLDMEVVLVGDDSDLMFWAEAETILNEFFADLPVEA